jgi:membrane associated rhomboid family serine protease
MLPIRETPKPLKILLLTTVVCNLLSGLFPVTQSLLSLSALGIKKLFLWQFITYLFVQIGQISFSLLVATAFNAYILWMFAISIIKSRGLKHFFILYFLSGLIAGLTAFGLLATTPPAPFFFAGNLAALYGVLIAWVTLNPTARVVLFFTLRVNAKNLIFILLGINIAIDLSNGYWINTIAYAASALFGVLYCKIFCRKRPPQTYARGKIFDFKTGKAILTDEDFLEEMLCKIAEKGKRSLTFSERFRLRRIIRKKKK